MACCNECTGYSTTRSGRNRDSQTASPQRWACRIIVERTYSSCQTHVLAERNAKPSAASYHRTHDPHSRRRRPCAIPRFHRCGRLGSRRHPCPRAQPHIRGGNRRREGARGLRVDASRGAALRRCGPRRGDVLGIGGAAAAHRHLLCAEPPALRRATCWQRCCGRLRCQRALCINSRMPTAAYTGSTAYGLKEHGWRSTREAPRHSRWRGASRIRTTRYSMASCTRRRFRMSCGRCASSSALRNCGTTSRIARASRAAEPRQWIGRPIRP